MASMMNGVNLGGWLVLEPWMSKDSAFAGRVPAGTPTSEFAITKALGAAGRSLIVQHRENFITSAHLDALAARGIDHLRVPLGHWATGSEGVDPSYVPGVLVHVDKLFDQAAARNMKVLLCMHAAPGSQNGFDHSSPRKIGEAGWAANAQHRLATQRRVCEWVQRYRAHSALLGVALLNEPTASREVLSAFYTGTYEVVRALSPSCLVVIAPNVYAQGGDVRGDDWRAAELRVWAAWCARRTRVALELHVYFTDWALGKEVWEAMSVEDIIRIAGNDTAERLAAYTALPGSPALLITEWSTAGPRYSSDPAVAARQQAAMREAQLEAFRRARVAGHCFWSARVDGNSAWSVL